MRFLFPILLLITGCGSPTSGGNIYSDVVEIPKPTDPETPTSPPTERDPTPTSPTPSSPTSPTNPAPTSPTSPTSPTTPTSPTPTSPTPTTPTEKDPRKLTSTASVFLSMISKFERELGVVVKDVPIGFGNLASGIAGTCYKYTGYSRKYREILVDRDTYTKALKDRLGQGQIEQLIYHELGHCVLDRGHNNATYSYSHRVYDNGCSYVFGSSSCKGSYYYNTTKQPKSIMRSFRFNWIEIDYLSKHRSTYITELKK